MKITANEIEKIVLRLIDEYHYQAPIIDSTIGVPWSVDKVARHVEMLKRCLVPPKLERFLLLDTFKESVDEVPGYADYWVIAKRAGQVEWYDPTAKDFGLGMMAANGKGFFSIGVRGDLVGVFCTM